MAFIHPSKRYRLFFDETGNGDLHAAKKDPHQRYLSVTGIVIRQDIHDRYTTRRLERLKADIFGHKHKTVVLHRREIMSRKAAFSEAFLRIEAAMDLVRNAVRGNSTTARQLVELGLVSASGAGYSLATGDPRQVLMALLYAGGRGAQIAANCNVSNRVADMLISNDPTVYLQGVRLVANRPRLMERLRAIGAVAGVGAGQQGSVVGASGQRAQQADHPTDDAISHLGN